MSTGVPPCRKAMKDTVNILLRVQDRKRKKQTPHEVQVFSWMLSHVEHSPLPFLLLCTPQSTIPYLSSVCAGCILRTQVIDAIPYQCCRFYYVFSYPLMQQWTTAVSRSMPLPSELDKRMQYLIIRDIKQSLVEIRKKSGSFIDGTMRSFAPIEQISQAVMRR